MIEVTGNIWDYPADWICITTNGDVKPNGQAVMGRGIALEAKTRHPMLPKKLGTLILARGNVVNCLGVWKGKRLYSFPTKHNWREKSDIGLIMSSVRQLLCYHKDAKRVLGVENPIVAMTRPGCGCGGLDWDDVKAAIGPMLDDSFVIVNR